MPKLIIDNIEVEVPAGTNVLEAAKQAGIWIPHFCYHPALGSVGACRLCAVKFLEGPVKGLQMSCMIPAQDGMVVSTTDAEALRMRSLVIEWLMINHPHDCPVCDEGGECLLQDYTIAGGHGIRRYQGNKRTFLPQYLGENIEHEMNRCIECYRCARFYQDYAGGTDFGVLGSAGRVYFGRFTDGAFASPFSGNLVDICPTGVFTDKTARYRARYWDYDMAPSVCPGCSLGCNIVPAARYRELLKIMAGRNDAVNGWFICDRARFGERSVNDPARPRNPMISGRSASWDEALDSLVVRIREVIRNSGPGSIALLGSPRLSLEGGLMLARLASLLETDALSYFTDPAEAEATRAAVRILTADNAASLADVRNADCVVLLDCDLLVEGPMMALAVRQAWRKGAQVYAVGGADSEKLAATVSVPVARVATLERVPLEGFQRAVLVAGPSAASSSAVAGWQKSGGKFFFLLQGVNAFAGAVLGADHGAEAFGGDRAESIKVVIAVEADIRQGLPEGVSVLAALDWLATDLVARAEVILPTAAWLEMDGTYINNEGRAQRFRKAMNPGLPIRGLDPHLHPPRLHYATAPGGEVRPAWRVIAEIVARLGGERIEQPLSGKWEKLRGLDPDGEGVRIL